METLNNKNSNIRDLAISKEFRVVFQDFSQSELESKKDELIEELTKLDIELEEFAAVRELHTAKRKGFIKVISKLKKDLRQKGQEEEMEVYLLDNQDSGLMEYYTTDGVMVHSRPLRPEERQLKLAIAKGGF